MTRAIPERGSITVWLLGWCVCLLFLGGLSVDMWRVANLRRDLAGIADAAAVAGASALDETAFRSSHAVLLDPTRARSIAGDYLTQHLPPSALRYVQATADRVEVRVEHTLALSLLGILLSDQDLRIAVSASVHPQRQP